MRESAWSRRRRRARGRPAGLSLEGARAIPASSAAWPRLRLSRPAAEVERRRGLDADRALAQRDPVEVLLEDRLLAEVPLQPERPEHLARFAGPAASRGPEHPRDLHRDGRPARYDSTRPQVGPGRPRHRARIHAAVAVEAMILDGDERRDQVGIHLRQSQPAAPAPVRGTGRPQLAAEAVLQGHHLRARIEHPRGKRAPDPRHQYAGGQREGRARPDRAPLRRGRRHAGHGPDARTVNTPPSLSPNTAGLYISSACAGGRMKLPGVVARAR